jgi:hypothetical protein
MAEREGVRLNHYLVSTLSQHQGKWSIDENILPFLSTLDTPYIWPDIQLNKKDQAKHLVVFFELKVQTCLKQIK